MLEIILVSWTLLGEMLPANFYFYFIFLYNVFLYCGRLTIWLMLNQFVSISLILQVN